ncbi:hypothetical protein PoB_000823300 [Plakobranchus ocellatus]|uniref:Uncharacterized protein n=1 Tax=Plakobranchus ocellatus TaxID=259542 RepID=A0AAV3YHT8_9GAST|nr:hypothetical protein PoB_000823300 [Plakobranchus ocellatus]
MPTGHPCHNRLPARLCHPIQQSHTVIGQLESRLQARCHKLPRFTEKAFLWQDKTSPEKLRACFGPRDKLIDIATHHQDQTEMDVAAAATTAASLESKLDIAMLGKRPANERTTRLHGQEPGRNKLDRCKAIQCKSVD